MAGFVEADYLDSSSHEAKSIGEVPYVLKLRVKWSLRTNTGSNNNSWLIAAIRHHANLVKIIHKLVCR